MKRQIIDKGVHSGFLLIALFSITTLFLIVVFLFIEGIPILDYVSIKEFVFGKYWYPTDDPADFGILSLILGSICVTLLSGIMAIPLGIMTAVYLAEIASPKVAEIVKPIVELMASMPSVIIGFFGMVVLMAAGGAAMIPGSIFDPVRPLPATIAAEMAEAPFGGEHYHALFAIGIVLFVFTFIFNLIADYISYKFRQVGEASL